jgi:DNA primase
MFDISSLIPGRKKQTQSGWLSFNAICCSHRGHKSDRRGRGGLKFDGNNWVMHCFNCSFSCSFTLGRAINNKTKLFLKWCGSDEEQIQRWSLESLQHKDLLDFSGNKKKTQTKFQQKTLPEGSEKLDHKNPLHKKYSDYVLSRAISTKYNFYITPNDKLRNSNRIIVPYTYRGKIVGNTSRFLDDRVPKYLNDQQPGYVFNIDNQKHEWQVCIVTEGIFDALAIDGVAIMHDDISTEQAQLLATLNKKIIVVPDFDSTGLKLIDKALEYGYSVSLPNWGPGVKDVNDAVVKYGKLPTLLAILQSATMSKIKLELQRKKIGKQNGF